LRDDRALRYKHGRGPPQLSLPALRASTSRRLVACPDLVSRKARPPGAAASRRPWGAAVACRGGDTTHITPLRNTCEWPKKKMVAAVHAVRETRLWLERVVMCDIAL
jgi:hypothetical protein